MLSAFRVFFEISESDVEHLTQALTRTKPSFVYQTELDSNYFKNTKELVCRPARRLQITSFNTLIIQEVESSSILRFLV